MLHQFGAYSANCTRLVRMHELASISCTHKVSLILRGKLSGLKIFIICLLMEKCWHNFCLEGYAPVACPVGIDAFFDLGDTNGKDRRRCNADAEGQRSQVR
jgi:hypothetical protein